VAFGLDDDHRSPLLAIGEAKWGETLGMSALERLRRSRAALAARNHHGAATAKLACFSGGGFSAELVQHAGQHHDVVLVTLADLYRTT
jgi:hypothetical protein